MTRAATVSERRVFPRLRALLDLVGPVEAPALLSQFHADLMACDMLIDAAIQTRDWLALRRASHNLTALAGTAGADELQHLAEALNLAARAEDAVRLAALCPATRTALSTLVDMIDQLSRPRGTE